MGCSTTRLVPNNGTQIYQKTPFPKIIPTPMASKGTVIGDLENKTPGKSIGGIALYFGKLLLLTPGPDYMVTMNISQSQKTYIRDDGRFIAENIDPGEYVLILWTPVGVRYVPDPNDSKKSYIVKVVGGQIVNIGTLSAPPLP